MNEWPWKSMASLQRWRMCLCSHFTMKLLHSALQSLVPVPISAPSHVSPFVRAEKQSILFIFLFNEVWWICLNLLQEIISWCERLTQEHFLGRSISEVPLHLHVEGAGFSCWERRGLPAERGIWSCCNPAWKAQISHRYIICVYVYVCRYA